MTSTMSIGKPICTQFASCTQEERWVYELFIFMSFTFTIINNPFIQGSELGIFTNGKPLENRPRPTTHTTGTMLMGLNNLFRKEDSPKD